MGTWGARIYEEDNALDLRAGYLDALKTGKPIEEIENEFKEFEDSTNDILALCCVQLETGTLTERTKQRALEVIESGKDLEVWADEAEDEDLGLRKRELTLIKKYLNNYDGKPVKRKSWVELQKVDKELENENTDKLDDLDWHYMEDSSSKRAAGAQIIVFYYWLISRNYLTKLHSKKQVSGHTALKISDVEKIIEKEYDWQLFAADVTEDVRPFVQAYYRNHNVNYLNDIFEKIRKKRQHYSFQVTEKECEEAAKLLDNKLQMFSDDPLSFHGQTLKQNLWQIFVFIIVWGGMMLALFLIVELLKWLFPEAV